MSRTLIGIVCGLIFVAAMLLATFGQGHTECQVCIDFRGASDCRTVSAPDQEQAIQQATATACSLLSSGVTQGMQCNRTPPRSIECSK